MSDPAARPIRLAARALIVIDGRVLLVNAYPGPGPNLWCLPGGGCEPGQSTPENLAREVMEETGLAVEVGALAGVSEFHNPDSGFHQVDLFFHARAAGDLPADWTDPEGVVHARRLASRDDLAGLPHAPKTLAEMAFEAPPAAYHGLRRMVRRADLP
ncbi:MAG: NUDIX domain-containing protein [Pseudomonadota bacterium]